MPATAPIATLALAVSLCLPAGAQAANALDKAVHNPARSAKFIARDTARHPVQELEFFGLRPDATVVEVWPGGGYWSEILAPYLSAHGTLYEALPEGGADAAREAKAFVKLVADKPAVFAKIHQTGLGKDSYVVAPAGTADFVLTFRNVHNWMGDGYGQEAFNAFFTALKPGGILGVEEHRGLTTKPQDPKAEDGYVRQDYAIALAQKAGFELVGSSELNANPRDTKEYPQGVWTLPPVFALGDKDHAKYAAIGEADNFVLKFRKPAK